VEFESIANHLVGLALVDLVSYFISGLKSDIRSEVLARETSIISHAASIA